MRERHVGQSGVYMRGAGTDKKRLRRDLVLTLLTEFSRRNISGVNLKLLHRVFPEFLEVLKELGVQESGFHRGEDGRYEELDAAVIELMTHQRIWRKTLDQNDQIFLSKDAPEVESYLRYFVDYDDAREASKKPIAEYKKILEGE
ncbi:MAG TPA: hypothetical protein VJC12_02075 [Candidatus Paceibacterota bacterium]